jgi:nitrite reductase/ring-hydroxylating ferredoxin subunit
LEEPLVPDPDLTRRRLVAGAAVGGLSLPLLAACGGGGSASTPSAGSASASSGGSTTSGGSGATVLVATADVPVGEGVVLHDQNVVVTQPSKGTFEGFTATCTHAGCPLADVAGGTINCTCHGSQFSITDGSNVTGPSGTAAGSVPALGKVAVKVQGADVVQG